MRYPWCRRQPPLHSRWLWEARPWRCGNQRRESKAATGLSEVDLKFALTLLCLQSCLFLLQDRLFLQLLFSPLRDLLKICRKALSLEIEAVFPTFLGKRFSKNEEETKPRLNEAQSTSVNTHSFSKGKGFTN